jgi:Multi-copper polyphenol oxidoreductase laccase
MHESAPTNETTEHPALVERFSEGEVHITTIGQPLNGRLLFSTPTRAEELYPHTSELRQELLAVVAHEAARHGVATIAVLRVDGFTASLTALPNLPTTEAEVVATDHGPVTILRGDEKEFFHDGLVLQKGEGALIVTGDCHTVVAWSDDPDTPVVASHAGRNSLHTINHTHPSGKESVIEEILQHFRNPATVHLRSVAGIGPDNFTHPLNHPTYGAHNQKLVSYFARYGGASEHDLEGHLDLTAVIAGQAAALDVPRAHITTDGLDTTTHDRLWSNRRDGKPRNTILVLHQTRR